MEEVLASADEDDDARLVYADWCEDEGDIARATFIRVQIERARRSEWDVEQIGLEVQEQKLLRENGARWLAEIEPIVGIEWTGFERGFPARAQAKSFGALVEARDAIVSALPLEHVTVPWPDSEARALSATVIPTLRGVRIERAMLEGEAYWLAKSPLLSTLTELTVADGYSEEPGTIDLLTSPHLRGLRKLALVRSEIGTLAVRGLIEADLPELSDLALEERGEEGDSWSQWEGGLELGPMQAFAGWAGLARLRRLDLTGNRIPETGFDALFQSPHLTSLDALRLEYVFTQADRIPWAAAPSALRIRELSLAHHALESARAITGAPCLRELRRLDLRGAVFEESTPMDAILNAFTETLEDLDLRDLDIYGDEEYAGGHDYLIRASLPRLHSLSVGSPYDRVDDGDELIAWADTDQLRSLRLTGPGLTKAATALASGSFPNLERLEIRGMTEASQAVLANSPVGKRLLETGGLLVV